FVSETSMRILAVLFFAVLTIPCAVAQQNQSQDTMPESATQAAPKRDKGKKEPTPASAAASDKSNAESGKPTEPPKGDSSEASDQEEHYDVAEVPPVITHHQITLNAKTLGYTATTGRLPIKRGDGKTEAE